MPLLRPRVRTASDVARQLQYPSAGAPGEAAVPAEDPYLLKLTKYIPAEIVAAYTFLSGALVAWNSPWSPWVCLVYVALLAIVTPAWIRYATTDPAQDMSPHPFQMYAGMVAFVVWVFALGGAWTQLLPPDFQADQPMLGSIVVAVSTVFIPLLEKIYART